MNKKYNKYQSDLKTGDKFALHFDAEAPSYEILEETENRVFTVKRLKTGIIDYKQKYPGETDGPVWIFK